jgi:hypothetical protein
MSKQQKESQISDVETSAGLPAYFLQTFFRYSAEAIK